MVCDIFWDKTPSPRSFYYSRSRLIHPDFIIYLSANNFPLCVPVRVNALRATWVTLALAAGVPVELVRRVTGHASVEIVLKALLHA